MTQAAANWFAMGWSRRWDKSILEMLVVNNPTKSRRIIIRALRSYNRVPDLHALRMEARARSVHA
jgi:hypothetical protein